MPKVVTNIKRPTLSACVILESHGVATVHEAQGRVGLMEGAEKLSGTYPFTLDESVRAYRLNAYLHDMVSPAHRARFLSDSEASFADAELSDVERALIRNRDWAGMIHYGAIFFGLEKLAAVLGLPNAVVYAGMRGQSLEDFQKTRNAPGASVYSVSDIKV